MSKFGEVLFKGSSVLRWTLGPVAVLSAVGFAALFWIAPVKNLAVFLAVEFALALLALVAIAPERFPWAGRTLAALVFIAYVAYLVDMIMTAPESFWPPGRRSAANGFSSVVGLLVIGYPALKFACLGRFSWAEPVEESSSDDDSVA